jgi:GAF domain-containing protein
MVDDAGENAVLVSSTGAAGRELLARRHSLSVGSDSVIGQVTARNIPIVAYDTGASDVVHRPNPLLPDTRSEMALPMRIGDRVIGALDVQSVAPNAFDEDIVAVFQVMADQLAIALDNARLQTELARTREQIAAIERRIVAEAWSDYESARRGERPLVYEFREDSILPETQFSPAPLNEAIARGQITMLDDGHGELNLAVPIKVRGEVIGAFGFGGESLAGLSEEDLQLVEAIVDRVGIALENLRLVEETARRVEHEQILNEITAKIVGATDVNQILQTTVRELGRVLRAPQTSVQLRQESAGS